MSSRILLLLLQIELIIKGVCAVRPSPSLQLLLQDPFYLIGIEFPPLFFPEFSIKI
jgi:hypothetical protein